MTVEPTDFIWMDGEMIPWDQANVHVSVHALHYGSSVFEGIRAYDVKGTPGIFRLDAHIQRLYDSCKVYRMDIPYAPAEIKQACIDTVRANQLPSAYIRPLVFRGTGTIGVDPRPCNVHTMVMNIVLGKYLGDEAIEQGVDVCVSSWGRMAHNTFPANAKIGGQYINSQLIKMEALVNGYTEGIALDANCYVSEGSGENIFVIRNGAITTPPLASCILRGITREAVMALAEDLGYPVQEAFITRESLYMADEVFFTGTAAEVSPIRSIDRISIGRGYRGPITEHLQKEFFGIVAGDLADRHGWLTMVN
ncbi:MAG: branched-chain amino acid transaminase [Anaerolineae bacterium]|nr:branched-chain amino acid transaminase [Anaerolineae bacterium]